MNNILRNRSTVDINLSLTADELYCLNDSLYYFSNNLDLFKELIECTGTFENSSSKDFVYNIDLVNSLLKKIGKELNELCIVKEL